MSDIFPEDFFNIPNPVSPWVTIQFRTSFDMKDGRIQKDNWEEITLNPSNFFDNLTLEDGGGIYHVILNLFDKNFANLENLIMKSITASRLANELSKNPNYVDDTSYFNFVITEGTNANLRIRFGYSIWDEHEKYIDSIDFFENYKERVNSEKPVIRTPWIYLQIMNVKTSFTQNGFKAELNCYSTTNAFLDRAKMIQKFAKLVGTPKDVLEQVGRLISNASNNLVKIEVLDSPQALKNEEGLNEIEVMLGTEPIKTEINGVSKIIPTYRSLKRLFDLICSKIEVKKYDNTASNVNQQNDDDGKTVDNENVETVATAKYGYSIIRKKENGKEINIIQFKYLDPIEGLKNQNKIRVYSWLNSGHSVVKSFNVQSSIDFAQMNAPITLINQEGQAGNFIGVGNKPDDTIASQNDFKIGVIKNISEGLKSGDFKAYFTTEVMNVDDGDSSTNVNQDSSVYASKMMSNVNNGVFKGNIEIQGDPFYLFDEVMSPYVYSIRLVVRRPDYYDKNGNSVDGGLSYLSGIYIIGKIRHTLNYSGFTTNLEVMRFPVPSKEKI